MDDTFRDFNKRYRAVTKKHRRLAHGYVTKLNRNGVIEHRPRGQAKVVSLRALLFVVSTFFVFKGYLLAGLGQDVYVGNVVKLAGGNPAEKVGAWLMQIDPLTVWIAQMMQSIGV